MESNINSKDVAASDENNSEGSYVYVFPVYFRPFEMVIVEKFELKEKNVTIQSEFIAGVVHFISCLYMLPVITEQMKYAELATQSITNWCALLSGIGSILAGCLSNLPIIVAPPTALIIFVIRYSVANSLNISDINKAIALSGICILVLGYRPLGRMFSNLVPKSIQYGTALGIGLLTALSGAIEVHLIQKGKEEILPTVGPVTSGILIYELITINQHILICSLDTIIVISGLLIIAIALKKHWRGAFCLCLIVNSFVHWISTNSFPKRIAEPPSLNIPSINLSGVNSTIIVLVFDLVFLYAIMLNGLTKAFCDLANITKTE